MNGKSVRRANIRLDANEASSMRKCVSSPLDDSSKYSSWLNVWIWIQSRIKSCRVGVSEGSGEGRIPFCNSHTKWNKNANEMKLEIKFGLVVNGNGK